MYIIDVCVIDKIVNATKEGNEWTVIWRVDFTGSYLAQDLIDGTYTGTWGLPNNDSVLADDTSARCNTIKAQLVLKSNGSDKGYATVTATFKPREANSVRDTISWTVGETQEEISFDIQDKPIVTSAKQTFNNPPTISVYDMTATITGYRTSYLLPSIAYTRWHVVNTDTLNLDGISVSAGQARLAGIQIDPEYIGSVKKYRHTWTLKFKPTWDLKLLNYGTLHLVGGEQTPIAYGADANIARPINCSGLSQSISGVATPNNHVFPKVFTLDELKDYATMTFDVTVGLNFGSTFSWSF